MVVDIHVAREPSPAEAELLSRLDWFIRLRWLAVSGLLITIGVVGFIFPAVFPLLPMLVIAAIIAGYNLSFWLYARRLRLPRSEDTYRRRYREFIHLQIVLDLVALTVLLHLAGGRENPFAFYYVFYVIIVSILLPQRSAFVYAGLVTALFGGLVFLEHIGLLPHTDLAPVTGVVATRNSLYVLGEIGAFASTVFLVVYMASGIARRLHERTQVYLDTVRSLEERTQELSEANARLRQADKARADFVLVVTHELRAPIAAIQSFLRVILEGYAPNPAKQRELLERADARATEMLDLIANLLELSRLTAGEQGELKLLDMGEVLLNLVDVMRVMAEHKGLMFSVEVDPHLPPVRANESRLKEVWTNLISNAIKYTPSGGIVVVSAYQTPYYVVGSVRDTGIGIAPEDQARLFTPFFRTEGAKSLTREGTGLGLSIVKQIVESYGGRIWVESRPGQGSKFSFALPRAHPSATSSTA